MTHNTTPKRRFSDAYLAKLKVPEGKREFIQFEAGTGLGVRASATGNISFIIQTRLKDGRRWRETLKPWGALTVEDARGIAQQRNADAARGGEDGDLFKKHADERMAARLSEATRKFTRRARQGAKSVDEPSTGIAVPLRAPTKREKERAAFIALKELGLTN